MYSLALSLQKLGRTLSEAASISEVFRILLLNLESGLSRNEISAIQSIKNLQEYNAG